ncbi:hypothetical protein EJB05_18002, partial [Eragrostis curvula]
MSIHRSEEITARFRVPVTRSWWDPHPIHFSFRLSRARSGGAASSLKRRRSGGSFLPPASGAAARGWSVLPPASGAAARGWSVLPPASGAAARGGVYPPSARGGSARGWCASEVAAQGGYLLPLASGVVCEPSGEVGGGANARSSFGDGRLGGERIGLLVHSDQRGAAPLASDLGFATMMASVEGHGELAHVKGSREFLILEAL